MYSSKGFGSAGSSEDVIDAKPAPLTAFQQRSLKYGPLFGVFLTLGVPIGAQLIGRCQYDWALIDMEHSPLSAKEMTSMVHATVLGSRGQTQPLVRIPGHGVEWVKWALDAGAAGIVVPMCRNAEDVQNIVEWGRYPPLGQRSFGPFQAEWADLLPDSGVNKYFSKTAADLAILPMIESVEGVANAESIMSVKGISGIFVGPVDLRLSMGLMGADGEEEQWIQALKKIADLGKKMRIAVGIFSVSSEAMLRQKKMGFSYFLVAGDLTSLSAGATSALRPYLKAKAQL
ncbi:hypothetical protein MMC08_002334 [Hypocenomyce scalaris]|nr:hypothetical protein [Hypocenomyce scalaris]